MPSVSTIELLLNLPPAGGDFTISPDSGDALITPFNIKLIGWADKD
jgi:hypothetical protein